MADRLDDCGHCTLLPTVTGTVRAEQATCPVHGTWPYAPLSAPSASSQALPADQDTRCPSRIAATTGAVIRCRFYRGHDGAHGNGLPGEGRAAWLGDDDDEITRSTR